MSSPLSGFTAVPNPQMLAFMGAQSFIMMYQAGEGWQYGKRRISAMSNEEFNKLTPQIVMEKQAVVLRDSLGTIQRSMNDMTPMIRTIIEQYGDFLRETIKAIPQTVENILHDPNHPTGGSSLPPAGVAGFITPAISLIPESVKQVTTPSHPHVNPPVKQGPPRDTRSREQIAFEKERAMVTERRIVAETKAKKDARIDLNYRQTQKRIHNDLLLVTKKMQQRHGKLNKEFRNASQNQQRKLKRIMGPLKIEITRNVKILYDMSVAYRKRTGQWL